MSKRTATTQRGQAPQATTAKTVLLFGGSGGMSNRYRDVVEERGLALRHYENRVPAAARHGQGTVGLVIVMVALAGDAAPVVYLRTGSISALRTAVQQWAGRTGAEAGLPLAA